jgi:hypothetical protein
MWLTALLLLGLLAEVSTFTSITPALLKETAESQIMSYVFTGRLVDSCDGRKATTRTSNTSRFAASSRRISRSLLPK